MARGQRTVRIALVAAVAAVSLQIGSAGVHAASEGRRTAMFRATNTSRLHHEVRRVAMVDRISELARQHSLKMWRTNDLFHTKDPAAHYLDGVRWSTWGENVGVSGGTVADMQAAFMRSSGHRANILNSAFEHVAVGAVRRDGVLWVTVFFWG